MFEEQQKMEIIRLDNGVIIVKTWNEILKDGVKISSTMPHGIEIKPGESALEGADQKVLDAIATFHTAEVIAAYQESITTNQEEGEPANG